MRIQEVRKKYEKKLLKKANVSFLNFSVTS